MAKRFRTKRQNAKLVNGDVIENRSRMRKWKGAKGRPGERESRLPVENEDDDEEPVESNGREWIGRRERRRVIVSAENSKKETKKRLQQSKVIRKRVSGTRHQTARVLSRKQQTDNTQKMYTDGNRWEQMMNTKIREDTQQQQLPCHGKLCIGKKRKRVWNKRKRLESRATKRLMPKFAYDCKRNIEIADGGEGKLQIRTHFDFKSMTCRHTHTQIDKNQIIKNPINQARKSPESRWTGV